MTNNRIYPITPADADTLRDLYGDGGDPAPLVKGGQGRDGEALYCSAGMVATALIAGLVMVAGLVVVAAWVGAMR